MQTDTRSPKRRDRIWQIVVIMLVPVLLWLLYGSIYGRRHDARKLALVRRLVCGIRLSTLGKAMNHYAIEFDNRYPAPGRWCDLLLKHAELSEHDFICRPALAKDVEARCHYAMNPNAEPNSPPDLVLLFESKGGWNQFGGPELLPPEPYHEEGVSVLLNNGDVKSIGAGQLAELNWKAEEPNITPQVEAPRISRRPANDYLPTRGKDRSER
ncbi:MAG: hypothetical protein JSU94_00775 [Phycisphaerales bacterium]|nr:MAG: hypothetical protein JSU94_00775 [Phycisphaerales bacterium]